MRQTAVVLVNWNGWRDTVECLASLLALKMRPCAIIVVDNASRDDSVTRIAAWCRGEEGTQAASPAPELPAFHGFAPVDLRWACVGDNDPMPATRPDVLLVQSSRNLGFAGGNNIGIRLALAAQVDFVWLLNTDTVVDPDALETLTDRALARPDAGIVGSTLLYYWSPSEIQALGGASFDRRTGASRHVGADTRAQDVPLDPAPIVAQTDYVVGASMLVSQAFLTSVGLMCEDYFLYYEEIDWAVRARGRFALAYAPQSRVFHKVGGSSRQTASRLSLRYLYRNRLVFLGRFFPESFSAARRHMVLQFFQHLRRGHWDDVLEIAGALATSAKPLKQAR